MAHISSQSAMKAMSLLLTEKDIRVSKSGTVRSATFIEKRLSDFKRTFLKDENSVNWVEKAKEAILNKLTTEIYLITKEEVSAINKDRLTVMLCNVRNLTKSSRPDSWRSELQAEIDHLRNESVTEKLGVALWEIDRLDQSFSPVIDNFIKAALSRNEDSDMQRAELEGLADYLKSDKKTPAGFEGIAAKQILYTMNRYGISAEKAMELLSVSNQNLAISSYPDKTTSKKEAIEQLQLGLINNLTQKLQKNYGISKDLAEQTAKKIDRLMQRYGLDIGHALDLSRHIGKMVKAELIGTNGNISELDLDRAKVVQHVMHRDGISMKDALAIANRRIAALPRIEAALPKYMNLSIVDEAISYISAEMSSDRVVCLKNDIAALSKLSTKSYTSPNDGEIELSKNYLLDTERDFNCTFNMDSNSVHFEKYTKDEQAALTDQLIKICRSTLAATTLSKITNQAVIGSLMSEILINNASAKQGGMLMLDPKDSIFLKKITEFHITRNADDSRITFRVISMDSNGNIADSRNVNQNWPINNGRRWDRNIDKSNFGYSQEMAFELEVSDLANGVIDPIFIRPPKYAVRASLDWDAIDEILAKPVAVESNYLQSNLL